MTTTVGPAEPNAARKRLARHLAGSGIEVGPGRYPFRLLPDGVKVRYVDRLRPADRIRLLAELEYDPEQHLHSDSVLDVEPDIVADLNEDRLGPIPECSEDFVIASHVLEHLADPIGFVDEIHRVLRPGGHTMILLPDRHRTEDRFRQSTALSHLVSEFHQHVTRVSDEHIVEFARDRGRRLPRSGHRRSQALERYREHSIHVHCWDAAEFADVLAWCIAHLGHQWELVDGCLYEPPIHYEFGYLLRRSASDMDAATRAIEFRRAWGAWMDAHLAERPGLLEGNQPRRLSRWTAQKGRSALRRSRLLGWGYRQGRRVLASATRRMKRRTRRANCA